MKVAENALELTGYRLPTAEEWGFACRAGNSGTFGHGESVPLLERYTRYVMNSPGRSHSVESLLPNNLGLFDMHGNVWEWTQTPESGLMSPVLELDRRVMLGGAFVARSNYVLPDSRNPNKPSYHQQNFGFRPAKTFHLSP